MSPSIVDRTFLINLDRRKDRLEEWFKQLPDPWPFPPPERVSALDGKLVPTPPQWKGGNGAWGCYRTHCSILEKCLIEGIDSYVVFEDDAGFCENFAEQMLEYADMLPDDWGMAYIGGQHLYVGRHPPVRINEKVYRPYNVNRTHAFMVRGRQNLKALYRHLHWNNWQPKQHIDHHIGRLTQRAYMQSKGHKIGKEILPTYTPSKWLSSQLPGKSNICGKRFNEARFFNDAVSVDSSDNPFFAVLGPHRSGSSCVAMVMHHLGVHMGNELGGYEEAGGGEALGLSQLCEKLMRFPSVNPSVSDAQISTKLQSWINQRKMEARRKGTVAGGKYPHLCRFAGPLYAAMGSSLRVVTCDRPIEASIASLQTRSRKHLGEWLGATDDQCEALQRSLLQHREEFLASYPEVPVHRILFADLTANPSSEIERLIQFLGITPTDEQFEAAVNHVQPKLRTHG